MSHKTDIHAPIPMPHIPGLLRRPDGRYYLNVRVPKDLRDAFGKVVVVRRALGTSEWKEAVSRLRYEAHKLEMEFEDKRRALKLAAESKSHRRRVSDLSEKEMLDLVFRWFIEMEKDHQSWWDSTGRRLADTDLADHLDDLRVESAAHMGGTDSVPASDCDDALARLLEEENIEPELPVVRPSRRVVGNGSAPQSQSDRNGKREPSPAFRRLSGLLQRATVECLRRSMDRVERKAITPHEDFFGRTFAHTPPPRRVVTLGELIERHSRWLSEAERASGTHQTYRIPYRLLLEAFGKNCSLENISKDAVEELFRLLCRAPANASQRFPGLTLKEAVGAADRKKVTHRLGAKTLDNYFNNITAIFNFAVEKGLMRSNPAKDKYSRALMKSREKRVAKVQFSVPELNRLFRTPLYVGCRNDMGGHLRPGNFRKRRGRFWLPLLALFHGLRCNEAAQLYTEDIEAYDGIPFFHIRAERADGSKCEKILKTAQSERKVPVHPELVRLGFMDFVENRRRDMAAPRLFPELELGKKGYFSEPFSKWFSRFKTAIFGKDCKATFHSFRHMFRDALRRAEVPIDDAERLGGWQEGSRSAEASYGQGPSLIVHLRKQIEKIAYPGLDLSHLYPADCNRVQNPVRVRRRRPAER